MDCALPAVFTALAGGPAAHPGMVVPPFAPLAGAPPPGAEKGTYGADLTWHVDGANFTVQWSDPAVDPARAEAILAAAEEGWERLVVDGGWPPPVSSDRWRLWIVLDTQLGASGFTTLYTSEDYPQGYPVLFVDPTYAQDVEPDFALSVTVHELGHALQYARRTWDEIGPEAWFWEASAEWMAEQGGPTFDTYAWSTRWYAASPESNVDTLRDAHAYGMVVLVLWLDEHLWGPDGVRDLWDRDDVWVDAIADQAGMPFGEIIREMAGAYRAGGFRESGLYEPPLELPAIEGAGVGEAARPGLFGSWYVPISLSTGEEVYASENVLVGYIRDGTWTTAAPEEGSFTATFTSVGEGPFEFGVRAAPGEEISAACGCAIPGSSRPGMLWLVAVGAYAGSRRMRAISGGAPRRQGAMDQPRPRLT